MYSDFFSFRQNKVVVGFVFLFFAKLTIEAGDACQDGAPAASAAAQRAAMESLRGKNRAGCLQSAGLWDALKRSLFDANICRPDSEHHSK